MSRVSHRHAGSCMRRELERLCRAERLTATNSQICSAEFPQQVEALKRLLRELALADSRVPE